MGHPGDEATGHLVPFGDHVFHCHAHVGKGGAKLAKGPLDTLPSGRLSRRRIVVDRIWGDHLVQQRDIPRSHGLVDLIIEAGRSALSLLRLGHWSARFPIVSYRTLTVPPRATGKY